MNERPILFSDPMVRAILAGTKMQTRRVADARVGGGGAAGIIPPCPYGVPGDRLWVREAWCPRSNGALLMEQAQRPFYRATDGDMPKPAGWPWRPSIHMPRWASRLALEIASVRVERVQSISEEDARAEGVTPVLVPPDGGSRPHREGFASLWDEINGERPGCSWTTNPWVWVVGFRVVL